MPAISVLLPTYNAERYILQSVQSVLGQTFDDFELLVVNDGSTDRTLEVLSSITDPRLRILDNPHNLGIVGSLNRAMAEAFGRYIVRIDADDFCLPTRFIKQKAFLDQHPKTVIVGTEMAVLEKGEVTRSRRDPGDIDPLIMKWMFYLTNPIAHPTMMIRADAVKEIDGYLRKEFQYAEDFDFSHRMLRRGDIVVIPEYLVIYRQHGLNLTLIRRREMIERTTQVLKRVYADMLGDGHDVDADLVSTHLIAVTPLRSDQAADVERLGGFLNQLVTNYIDAHKMNDSQRDKLIAFTGRKWWHLIQASLREGRVRVPSSYHGAFRWSEQTRPKAWKLARSMVSAMVPHPARRHRQPREDDSRFTANGVEFQSTPTIGDDPPTLYVVVDTEAEFDWSKGFDRSLTSVTAIRRQGLAQTIFETYGVRPIYLVDYAVASQSEGYEPLREIFDRKGCVIGAHLHPWVNPPFEEAVSEYNSFAGNLPPDLEERKLQKLIEMIKRNFGVAPLFFKAGRYGVGPHTMETLTRLGVVVDFSILPMTDMRNIGGPDFRFAEARPYRVGQITSIPMTRGQLGMIAPLPPRFHAALRSPRLLRMHLPGILSRLRLANTVTLTPEGVSAQEQIRLIRAMAARGARTFVLHYHSPSLGKQTPYVRTDADLTRFLDNLKTVCAFFFETLGGLPGNPADLVPPALRDRIFADRGDGAAAVALRHYADEVRGLLAAREQVPVLVPAPSASAAA
jgi:glycosyltransferase involved in cell wall biosynthesis